ncbi:lantibiotic dehydratase [Streptomyces sp. NPDC088768]|uniref:lantibiotic dehydratase n=1 Tax=Streptomyces sp. NPDC088768 TaxID=3365894 RepID=UPI0038190257
MLNGAAVDQAWPDLRDESPAGAAARLGWLRTTWAVPVFADAVRQSSPDLAARLDALLAQGRASAISTGELTGLAGKTLAYLLRSQWRPTPLGLFAGVAEGVFGSRTRVSAPGEHDGHTVVARPGARWVHQLVEELHALPGVRRRLDVVANNILVERGQRTVLPWRRRAQDFPGTALHEVSVASTPAVRAALAEAAVPVPFTQVASALADRFHTTDQDASALLDTLIGEGFLLTSLTLPATTQDPLGSLLVQLRRHGAATELPEGLASRLSAVHHLLREHNATPRKATATSRAETLSLMRACGSPAARKAAHLDVDTRLNTRVELPRAVGWAIQDAAAVLVRVSGEPQGARAWRRYTRRFMDRYGQDALVPVTDLLNPAVGLGVPEDFHGTPRSPHPDVSARDRLLLRLAQTATRSGNEVTLTEELIERLGVPGADARGGRDMELAVQVWAPTQEHLDGGDFTLLVCRTSRGWGHLTGGRLAALLEDSGEKSPLVNALRQRPTTTEGATRAQLSFPALLPSGAGLTRAPELLPRLIPLSEHRPDSAGHISLADLAVMCHQGRLILVDRAGRQVVEASALHPLQIEFQTPTVARFFDELCRGQAAQLAGPKDRTAWDWGTLARHLPDLPRVRYGRTILSPATWKLDPHDLPGPKASTREWDAFLSTLRARRGIPEVIQLQEFDKMLRLDLREPSHRDVLRRHLEHDEFGALVLREAEPATAHGWNNDHATMIVALLASTTPALPAPSLDVPVITPAEPFLPGASAYLPLRLPAHPEVLRQLLADHLPEVLPLLGHPTWWLTPHAHAPQLVFRFPRPMTAAEAVPTLNGWLSTLHTLMRAEFVHAYHPHPGLWGVGPLHVAAEDVWAADSQAWAHQLTHPHGVEPGVAEAVGILDTVRAWHATSHDAFAWLAAQPKPTSTTALNRPHLAALRSVTLDEHPPSAPYARWREDRALGAERHRLDRALATYSAALQDAKHPGADAVLRRLLELQHHRRNSTEPLAASPAWRLARALALSQLRPA